MLISHTAQRLPDGFSIKCLFICLKPAFNLAPDAF